MTSKTAVLALVLAALALGLTVFHASSGSGSAKKETPFERVMRTRTLRCAYSIWAPFFTIDPNTKQKGGIDYDIMEAIGKAANLKIDWSEDVGFGSYPEALQSGRQDAFCVTVWVSAARAARVDLSTPTHFSPLYAFVRDGDARFDNNLWAIDDEKTTVGVIDGSTQMAVAKSSFPKAKHYALPGDSDGSQVLMALASGKADVVFSDESVVLDYNKNNPGHKLKRAANAPIRIFGEAFSTAKSEGQLRDMLSAAIFELYGNGTIERILAKHEAVPGAILRAAPAYVLPGEK
jgi:ABC-type amino acid transport substrate-binding protein